MMVAYTAITKVLRKSIINDRQNSKKYHSTRILQSSACTRNNFIPEELLKNSTIGTSPEVNTFEDNHQTDVLSDQIAWRTGQRSNRDQETVRSVYESRSFTIDEFSNEVRRIAPKSAGDTNFRRRDAESTLGHRDEHPTTEDVSTVTTCSTVPKKANNQTLHACDRDGMHHRSKETRQGEG